MSRLRRFLAIDPHARELKTFHAESFDTAIKRAGLKRGKVDFGTIMNDGENVVQVVVNEFGLYDPKAAYFTLGKHLYAGPALVFQEEPSAKHFEVDLELFRIKAIREVLRWYVDAKEVEQGVLDGRVIRPSITIGDQVVWLWPAPKPDLGKVMAEAMAKMGGKS
jgi:hypothetical protein